MKYLDINKEQIDKIHMLVNSEKKYLKVNEFTNNAGDVIVLMAHKKENGIVRLIWVSLNTFLSKDEKEVMKLC